MKKEEKEDFEKWRIREELSLQILTYLNNATKEFKSTTVENYKPTNNDINVVLSRILNKRLEK